MRREEDGVLVCELSVGDRRHGIHLDRQLGPGRRVIEEREGAVRWSAIATPSTSVTMPGDVGGSREAAELAGSVGVAAQFVIEVVDVDPGRRRPRAIVTTSTADSRHGSSLEWCSYGPTNTTGRGPSLEVASRAVSLSIAAVAPEPQNTTVSSSPPPTAWWMMRRASSRRAVVRRPVADPRYACSRTPAAPAPGSGLRRTSAVRTRWSQRTRRGGGRTAPRDGVSPIVVGTDPLDQALGVGSL